MYRERAQTNSNWYNHHPNGSGVPNLKLSNFSHVRDSRHARDPSDFDENYNPYYKKSMLDKNESYGKTANGKNPPEQRYYWERKAKESRAFLEMPSFGNTIRQSNEFADSPSSYLKASQDRRSSIHSDERERSNGKVWDRPIGSNLRAEQLKCISKQRVTNIEKINFKIKGILDKLNE